MNRITTIEHDGRAVPLQAATFAAFKVSDTGRTYELGSVDGSTAAEAMNAAIIRFALFHKEHLVIRESGDRGVKLHVYAIKKKSAARYVWQGHEQKRMQDLYAAPLCVIDGSVLLPLTQIGNGQ